jgi:phosphatidylserine/phosphatidylglycerophosphate/cardiolipin synthase-like enzyme
MENTDKDEQLDRSTNDFLYVNFSNLRTIYNSLKEKSYKSLESLIINAMAEYTRNLQLYWITEEQIHQAFIHSKMMIIDELN